MLAMSTVYKYDAFISYCHLDKKVAVKVQRQIERYRIPKTIREERGNESAKLEKAFRDETDLPAGSLKVGIDKNLDASAKLIVICSPNTKKSDWVTKEVQHFIDEGRSNDILPLVINGKWTDVLPENLVTIETKDAPFISDNSKLGKRTAFLKVLAAVLRTDFDALVKREKTRRIRLVSAVSALCLLVALSVVGYYNYNYVPHTKYYADYVMQNGKPTGIAEMSVAQRSTKRDVFKITITRNLREIHLEHTNSAGIPSEDFWASHIESPTVAVYDCLDNWQVNTVEYYDTDGKQIYTYAYAPDLSYVDLIKSKNDAQWITSAAGNSEYGLPVRTNISRYQLTFDSNGFLSQRMYAVDRLNAVNEDGVGGEAYKYDGLGRLVQVRNLNIDGEPIADKRGVAGKSFAYDDSGSNYRLEYFGIDGQLINNALWYAVVEESYNANGNAVETRYFDSDYNLTITAKGYAVEKYEYNDKGFVTANAYFGVDDEPVYGQYKYHRVQLERDDIGRDIGDSYWDTAGNLILTASGYAKRVNVYNDSGRVIEQRYYGSDGNPNLGGGGAHKVLIEYDESGNETQISNYGIVGELVFTTRGYAIIRETYNDLGLQTSHSYYGVYAEPIIGNEGFHKQAFIYDARANISEIKLTGTLEQPVLCASGYASRKLKYDNAGNILEDAYFDDYGTPTFITGYISKAVMKYNERGNRISTDYYNPDGLPATRASYAKIEQDYDEYGKMKEERRFNTDGLSGKTSYRYDNVGRTLSETLFIGELPSRTTTYVYDVRGNTIEITNLNGNGNPINDTLGRTPYKLIREYDQRGNITMQSDNSTYSFETVFNANGLPIKTSYFDINGNLSRNANSERVAIVESDYNDKNLKIERRCFDEQGNPLAIPNSYAKLSMDYDKNGNCVDSVYYDAHGNVYQRVLEEYDDYNRETNRIYYDGENNQLVRREITYNALGKATSDALYNRNDMPQADLESGVSRIVYFYDEYGYVVGQEFYGADNNLIAPYGLYAKYITTRENGRTVRTEYYGENNRLLLNEYGYAIEEFTYDEYGNESGRAFYGIDGKPVLLHWRFSKYEVKYDELGNISESKFYDTAGREVLQVDGHIERTEAMIRSIPQKILIFRGNDGNMLMGQIEIKLFIPLKEFIESLPAEESVSTSADESDSVINTESKKETDLSEVSTTGSEEATTHIAEPSATEIDKRLSEFSEREYISAVDRYVRALE
ncbi:MAG: TIR domain-containing protein, partial [Oscillospiraceae bacterium]|nr:TIR domain-containing protein [Oscillospiraceae bacterium]